VKVPTESRDASVAGFGAFRAWRTHLTVAYCGAATSAEPGERPANLLINRISRDKQAFPPEQA